MQTKKGGAYNPNIMIHHPMGLNVFLDFYMIFYRLLSIIDVI